MNALTKLRHLEEELNELKEQIDERDEERAKIELKFTQLTQVNSDLHRQIEKNNIEQLEELKTKLQREKEALLGELENSKSINTKLAKSNQKLTNDINDLNNEIENYRTTVQNVEKQQRAHEKKLQEEKTIQDRLRQERDRNERDLREKETQRLNLLKDLEERQIAFDELDKKHKQLKAQIESNNQATDDVGRYIQDLEKTKRNLETALEDQKQQIVELEDELQTSEDARLRLDVNVGALKQQIEKLTLEFTGELDERTRGLNKRCKEYEVELQELQTSKQQIVQQKKKLDSDFQLAIQQLEEANRSKEDALRNNRKLQVRSILSKMNFI